MSLNNDQTRDFVDKACPLDSRPPTSSVTCIQPLWVLLLQLTNELEGVLD